LKWQEQILATVCLGTIQYFIFVAILPSQHPPQRWHETTRYDFYVFYARSQTTYQRLAAIALAPHIEILEFLFHALSGICRVNFIQFHWILVVNVLKIFWLSAVQLQK
jgi:hypothetical protein